jgi:hypothetical protein
MRYKGKFLIVKRNQKEKFTYVGAAVKLEKILNDFVGDGGAGQYLVCGVVFLYLSVC